MNALLQALARFLRGPSISSVLKSMEIDPRRYWLLIDLFKQLSDRREMLSHLGSDGLALKSAAWLYLIMSGLGSFFFIVVRPPLWTFFWGFLFATAFLLLGVLLSETSNSLVNPLEGLVLAHQPIDGATYTAAKLTHLLRILLYLVPALNAVPSLAGLVLKGSAWWYPLAHMLAAFVVGLLVALLCCAVFGWLIRFVPSPRLKAAGQIAEMVPWVGFLFFQYSRDLMIEWHIGTWLPARAETRLYLSLTFGLMTAVIVLLGIRSLSGDYLIRVSSIVRGRPAAKANVRRSRLSEAIASLSGGQGSRAGFEYVSRMMLRDWQFRRQMIPLLPMALGPAVLLARDFRITPFSGRFTVMHVLPHLFGVVLFWICTFLPYGNDHKGSWIFLLAPGRALGRFARGVYALLWVKIVVIPHVLMLFILAWLWGLAQAGVFAAYSLAVSSVYLGLELRLVDGVPFGKQAQSSRSPMLFPLMILGGFAIAIAVALQHFFIFRSPASAVGATLVLAACAWFLARSAVEVLEVSLRYNLGLVSGESAVLYQEVDA